MNDKADLRKDDLRIIFLFNLYILGGSTPVRPNLPNPAPYERKKVIDWVYAWEELALE